MTTESKLKHEPTAALAETTGDLRGAHNDDEVLWRSEHLSVRRTGIYFNFFERPLVFTPAQVALFAQAIADNPNPVRFELTECISAAARILHPDQWPNGIALVDPPEAVNTDPFESVG